MAEVRRGGGLATAGMARGPTGSGWRLDSARGYDFAPINVPDLRGSLPNVSLVVLQVALARRPAAVRDDDPGREHRGPE